MAGGPRSYFGDGDECHMCFHFPLMPAAFMAVAARTAYPIPRHPAPDAAIPEAGQWAIFLRNHDELTLEIGQRPRTRAA